MAAVSFYISVIQPLFCNLFKSDLQKRLFTCVMQSCVSEGIWLRFGPRRGRGNWASLDTISS